MEKQTPFPILSADYQVYLRRAQRLRAEAFVGLVRSLAGVARKAAR